MPILYKGNQRVLFVHIPKTAGVSVYGWFYNNGWRLSNIKFGKMTSELFNNNFGVSNFDIEGLQIKGIPPQHAHYQIYKHWGEFTSAFTIVRNPLDRFISEINYYFKLLCHAKKINITSRKAAIFFANDFTINIINSYKDNTYIRENHIRPQIDFISKETEVIFFEKDWISNLSKKYGLMGTPPHINRGENKFSFSNTINNELKEKIIVFYKMDYKAFGYKIRNM